MLRTVKGKTSFSDDSARRTDPRPGVHLFFRSNYERVILQGNFALSYMQHACLQLYVFISTRNCVFIRFYTFFYVFANVKICLTLFTESMHLLGKLFKKQRRRIHMVKAKREKPR